MDRNDQKYPFISVIALNHGFITREQFEDCVAGSQNAVDRNQAILNHLKLNKILSRQSWKRLWDIYMFFVSRQDDIRFGALCISLKTVPPGIITLALEEQQYLYEKTGNRIQIGALLVDAGMITERQRNLILTKQARELAIRNMSPADRSDPTETLEEKDLVNHVSDNDIQKKVAPVQEPDIPMKEIRGLGLVLRIQNDLLKAFLIKTPQMERWVTAESIREFIAENHIIFGVVEKQDLEHFVESDFYMDNYMIVAHGLPVVESTSPNIDYVFERDHLQAGFLHDDGTMDFKDRGQIPLVKVGDLLVRKTPAVQGRNGSNIYGETIAPILVKDIELRGGNGVVVSSDGLAIHAAITGYPRVDLEGIVSVIQEYTINGNVDYSTGHIDFDGIVTISGIIKSGFRVAACGVNADAIEGGIVNCSGDVSVRQGITKASITARGKLTALFIHHSDITCMGSLEIIKEMLDSRACVNGTCISRQGRILSSTVTAKMGIKVHDIGTEQTRASFLTVGVSRFTEMELSRLNSIIEMTQREIDGLYIEKEKIESQISTLEYEIINTEMSGKKSEAAIRKFEDRSSGGQVEEVKNVIDILQFNCEKAQKKCDVLKEQLQKLEQTRAQMEININLGTAKVQKLVREILILKQMDNENPANPVLEVEGNLMPGTRVAGRHTQNIISQKMSRVKIREVMISHQAGSEASDYILDVGVL
ncbi:MAG: FapA family protein [Pseudomonadota bacterium]